MSNCKEYILENRPYFGYIGIPNDQSNDFWYAHIFFHRRSKIYWKKIMKSNYWNKKKKTNNNKREIKILPSRKTRALNYCLAIFINAANVFTTAVQSGTRTFFTSQALVSNSYYGHWSGNICSQSCHILSGEFIHSCHWMLDPIGVK